MLIGIFGDLGSYKTSLACALAREACLDGLPVWSNYLLRYKGCQEMDLSGLLSLDTVERGQFNIDEIYTIAESRISSSKVNRFFSYFIFQTRKLGVDVVYTSQLSSAVDLRLFQLSPVKFACFGLNEKTGYVKLKCLRNNKLRTGHIAYWFFEKYVFPFFDTRQRIAPLGIDDLLVEVERFDLKKFNLRVDKATAQLEKFFSRSPNKYEVEDLMLQYGIPLSLSRFVYNRLKSRYSKQ